MEAPGTGAIAAPSGALSSLAGELAALGATSGTLVEAPVIHSFGSPGWEATLLAAVNPADFESLGLVGSPPSLQPVARLSWWLVTCQNRQGIAVCTFGTS